MKQTASILLLTLLAFNWVGYRFVSGYFEHASDLSLESRIDNSDYDESNLIEIRVPLNAPYLNGNSASFERYSGELELGGVHYKYVKRKVERGELVLLCLPNENKTRFQNSRVDFFKLVNDLNHTGQKEKNNTSSAKSFVTEYKQEDNSWVIMACSIQQSYSSASDIDFQSTGFKGIEKQPPRA